MAKDMESQQEELERLTIQDDIEEKRLSISQKKAIEREMRKTHGRDWKKVLGVVGSAGKHLRPNSDAIQDLYAVDPGLKDGSGPGRF